ncbi:MAG: hypothetical protein GVY29_05150 [Spirochaetes bacterium]|jgi:hypothetical protein|nr:hypothetical protein [Spirochaetota bacterium]
MPDLLIPEGSVRPTGNLLRTFWRGFTKKRRVRMSWRFDLFGDLEKAVTLKLWGLSAVSARMHRVRRQMQGRVAGTPWSRFVSAVSEIPSLSHEDSFRFVGAVRDEHGKRPTFSISAYTYMAGLGAVAPFEVRSKVPWPIQKPLLTVAFGEWVTMEIDIKPDEIRYRAYPGDMVLGENDTPWFSVPAISPMALVYQKNFVYAGGGPRQPHCPTDLGFRVKYPRTDQSIR